MFWIRLSVEPGRRAFWERGHTTENIYQEENMKESTQGFPSDSTGRPPTVTAPLWLGACCISCKAHHHRVIITWDKMIWSRVLLLSRAYTIFIKSFPQKRQKKGEVHSIKTNSFCFKVTYRSVYSNHTRYSRMFCNRPTIKAQCCSMS